MRGVALALLVVCACLVGAGTAAARPAGTPQAYVSTLCSAVAAWEHALVTREAADERSIGTFKVASKGALAKLRSQPGSIAKVRSLLIASLAYFETQTRAEVAAVSVAGVPAVPGGAALASKVVTALGQVEAVFRDALARARAMSLLPATLASQVKALIQAIQEGQTRLEKVFSALGAVDSPALDAAAKASPACKKLFG